MHSREHFPKHFFKTQSQEALPSNKTVANTIDSVEKLEQYEQSKKKIDVQVFRKLGIIEQKDKKLFQIRDLQARALKLRLKVNKEPAFSPSSLTTSLKFQMMNQPVGKSKFHKI